MGRIFRAPLSERVIATADGVLDLFELIAGANNKLRLVKFRFESSRTQAELVPLRLVRRSTTGTGGVGAVEVKTDEDDGAITASVNFDVTSPGTIGDILGGYEWEQLGPLEEIFLPKEELVVKGGGRLCLEIASAIPTDSTMSGYVVWEEE